MWRLDKILLVALCWNLWILLGLLVRVIYRLVQEIEQLDTSKEE